MGRVAVIPVAQRLSAPGSLVTISTSESGATLRLTLDGTDPTSTSAVVVSGTSMLIGNFTLKVRAFRSMATDSNVRTIRLACAAIFPSCGGVPI